MTAGYYYSNEVYRRGAIEVVIESASYVAHHEGVQRGVLQKLVFRSTGRPLWRLSAQRPGGGELLLTVSTPASNERYLEVLQALATTPLRFAVFGSAALLLRYPALSAKHHLRDADLLLPRDFAPGVRSVHSRTWWERHLVG